MAKDPIKDVTWRSQVEAHVQQLRGDLARAKEAVAAPAPAPPAPTHTALTALDDINLPGEDATKNIEIAQAAIERAHELASESPGLVTWARRWASGSDIEAAWSAIHDADAALVMVLPWATLLARLPDLRAGLATTLDGDGRLDELTATLKAIEAKPLAGLTVGDRTQLRAIRAAVDSTADIGHSNIRNYRNWLLIVSACVLVGLIVVAIGHAFDSEFIFIAEKGSHGEISADVAELEAAGALGGLLMAIFALIRLKVYSGPVALPLWLALVRIPAGAVAALAGTALLQGELFSSFARQPRSGVLAYAVLFGAAPEIILRFFDNKVNEATAAVRPKNDPLKQVPKPK